MLQRCPMPLPHAPSLLCVVDYLQTASQNKAFLELLLSSVLMQQQEKMTNTVSALVEGRAYMQRGECLR